MKVNRYIALLLLICFSAFLGHNLVPHHHHPEAFLNPIATDCPVEHDAHHGCDLPHDGKDPHPGDHSTHCHAFNDVVFKKHQALVLTGISVQSQDLLPTTPDVVPDLRIAQVPYTCNGLKFPLRNIKLGGSRDLRGPPHTA